MMNWTEKKIENYKVASDYTLFHKKLSVLAEPYLDSEWTLADIGCGPGLLSFKLAPMVRSIDAIDNDSVAIEDLKKHLDDIVATDRRTADKITPWLTAVEDLKNERWDVVTMCFFGLDEEVLETVLPLANHRALIYMHGRPDKNSPIASLDDGEKFTMPDMENYLKQKNLIYKKNVMEMQFGQPFRTIDDIHRFLMEYRVKLELSGSDTAQKDGMEMYFSDIEDRIVQTNRYDYPYYLPKSINVAMFIIKTQ